MIYEICTQTHTGLVRANNEDAVAVDAATGLCILADGMGGYNAGEVASSMAVTFIKSELGRWLGQAGLNADVKEVRRALQICVENSNYAVFNAGNANSKHKGMGTTLVVGVFQLNRLILGHIGDSRCYRLRGQEFQQITKDHSFLQEQIEAGHITPEQALTSSHRNLVTRALGVEGTVRMDVNEHRVNVEDIYLLCSDGLSDMVLDQEIAGILLGKGGLDQKCASLVAAANHNGGHDNISILLVHAQAGPTKRSLLSKLLRK